MKLEFATVNEVFSYDNKQFEIGRILDDAANKFEANTRGFLLRDFYGNTVGSASLDRLGVNEVDSREKIVIEITNSNAAFADNDEGWEVARILRDAANKVRDGIYDFNLRDINGNKVGKIELVQEVKELKVVRTNSTSNDDSPSPSF